MDLLSDLELNTSFSSFTLGDLPPIMDLAAVDEHDSSSSLYSPTSEHASMEDSAPATSERESSVESAPPTAPRRGGRRKKSKREDDDDFVIEDDDEDVEEERPATLNTKKNQSRKRRLMDQAPESVVLSRDVLLTISSSEYEELVAAVTEQRPLSESEKKEVRRQKRLIKNRESAAQSRSRKKRALETLEEENSKLRSELEVAQKRWAVTEAVLEQAPHLWDQIKTRLQTPLLGGSKASPATGMGLMLVLLLSVALWINVPGLALSSMRGPMPGADLPPQSTANLRQLMSVDNNSHILEMECAQDANQHHESLTQCTQT